MGYKRMRLNHELLTAEEELDLINRYQKKGDIAARDRLVSCNLRLVPYVLKGFRGIASMPPFEDLVQEGNVGLLKAADKFNPESGNRFATYAVWWIRAQAWLYIGSNATLVNISRKKFQELCRAHREGKDKPNQKEDYTVYATGSSWGRSFDSDNNTDVEESTQVLRSCVSLDAPIISAEYKSKENLHDKLTYSTDSEVDSLLDLHRRNDLVDEAIEKLPSRDRVVIEQRYKKGRTLQEVGESLELSRERIRQLETRAFKQMRKFIARKSVCHSLQENRV